MNTLCVHCVKEIKVGKSESDSIGGVGYRTREIKIETTRGRFTINLFFDCEVHGE